MVAPTLSRIGGGALQEMSRQPYRESHPPYNRGSSACCVWLKFFQCEDICQDTKWVGDGARLVSLRPTLSPFVGKVNRVLDGVLAEEECEGLSCCVEDWGLGM